MDRALFVERCFSREKSLRLTVESEERRSLGSLGRAATAALRKNGIGMKIANEFKAFVLRGNVVELAIAVVIGVAFGAVVTAS